MGKYKVYTCLCIGNTVEEDKEVIVKAINFQDCKRKLFTFGYDNIVLDFVQEVDAILL